MARRVVIVGGGHAGGRVAQILAQAGADLDIVLVGSESHPPYNRPPLSKGVLLGTSTLEDCLIWRQDDAAWDRVRFLPGVSATALNRAEKIVAFDGADPVRYDTLVLATGSRVRRLTMPGADSRGVYNLRRFDDATGIARQFREGRRLLVVGGGFVGLEIAAAARMRGLDTVVVEASDRLLSRIAPQNVGEALSDRHRAAGVSFRFGCMVEKFAATGSGALKSALLSTGEVVPCDLAVAGVGVTAETQLARAAGLEVEVGIRTDAALRTSDPAIFACGDCASFWHPLFERHVRVEAWQNAEDHARVVAAGILGRDAVCDTAPFFWSDQYELSMQIVGLPHLGSSMVSKPVADALILYHLDARGRLVGATGLGRSETIGRPIRVARHAIAQRTHPDPTELKAALSA